MAGLYCCYCCCSLTCSHLHKFNGCELWRFDDGTNRGRAHTHTDANQNVLMRYRTCSKHEHLKIQWNLRQRFWFFTLWRCELSLSVSLQPIFVCLNSHAVQHSCCMRQLCHSISLACTANQPADVSKHDRKRKWIGLEMRIAPCGVCKCSSTARIKGWDERGAWFGA